MALHVEIVDRKGSLWSGNAASVVVPSADGDLGVLPGHQPLLVVLRKGVVTIDPSSAQATRIEVERGFASVDSDAVTIVVERDL